MKKITTVITLTIGLFLFAASVSASPQMTRPGNRHILRPGPERLLDVLKTKQGELKLTDKQLNKIEELTFAMEDKAVKLRSDIASTQLELRRQMRDMENRDYEKIKSLLMRSAELRADMVLNRMTLREEITNILTPEQRTALKETARPVMRTRRFMERRELFQRNPRMQKHFFRR